MILSRTTMSSSTSNHVHKNQAGTASKAASPAHFGVTDPAAPEALVVAAAEAAAEVALPAVADAPGDVEAESEVAAPVAEAVDATDAALLEAPLVKLAWLVSMATRPVAFVQALPIVELTPVTKFATAH